jgi:hypothetical protein
VQSKNCCHKNLKHYDERQRRSGYVRGDFAFCKKHDNLVERKVLKVFLTGYTYGFSYGYSSVPKIQDVEPESSGCGT